MAAFHNALREEGTRAELLTEIEREWKINADLLIALSEIAMFKTWNQCAQARPQVRPTKADLSNDLDRAISIARAAVRKVEGR